MFKEFLTIDVWSMINTWLNLLVLLFLFKKFLYKPVMNVLAARESEINRSYEDAEQAREEALQMKADYEEQMKTAKEQAADIVNRATKKANAKGEEIIGQAKEQAVAIAAKAQAETEQIRKKAAADMRNEMGEIAIDIAKAVLQKEIDPADHSRLVDEFIEGVGDNNWQSR
ncbi:MAG: F0F1 ATP synthase subunit B [Oscillospiraceae bacterium]|nr:F0F1 ATP synthase subunit B [Oscillospiraceae bacterium]